MSATILNEFGKPAVMQARAYYEGAHSSPLRSILPGVVQEARKDLSRATRRELLRSSRALWKNNPLIKAITERLVTYTIGTGIMPEPASSDEAWNQRAIAVFDEWAKRPDLSSKQSLAKLQEVTFRSTLIDGDIFILKTWGSSGRPRIQLIESDVIGSPNIVPYSVNNDDGIIGDANGRPVEYIAREKVDAGAVRERRLPADAVIHLANIERARQGRGAPLAAACLTTGIDLHDILDMEKAAVKDASGKTDVIKTESGEYEDNGPIGRSTRVSTTAGTEVVEYYREVFGPTAKVMKHGDDYAPYEPKRPGPAWQGFVDFLAELCCLSYNLPPSLVRQLKVGGADTRRDLAIMQRVVEGWQYLTIIPAWQQVYEYVIEAEIEDGPLANPPRDWRACDWQTPRAVTVDAGRMSAQDREDVRTGNMTLREAFGQYGLSWRKEVKQLVRELIEIYPEISDREARLIVLNRFYGQQGQPVMPDKTKAAKDKFEAYGIGVRAGALTPNISDEAALRAESGLPVAPAEVTEAWKQDGGVRKPITLASQKQTDAEAGATKTETDPTPEDK